MKVIVRAMALCYRQSMRVKIYKTTNGILAEMTDRCVRLPDADWDAFLNQENLLAVVREQVKTLDAVSPPTPKVLQAPIEGQELWAAGVTYYKSRTARMEEAQDAGGGSFYDRVYEADRPELFFKATAHRVADPGGPVRIRRDSTWDVPEPELTLCINARNELIGYTIGNDMSSRSIEGENPLYLPQAKTYDQCAALGPCILLTDAFDLTQHHIGLTIDREGEQIFQDRISLENMKRTPEELTGFLTRECSFPAGCFLMTGTGIVPDHPFTLQPGDQVHIDVDGIGRLSNSVVRG